MTKLEAKMIAIDLAKTAILSPTGNVSVYPCEDTACNVADFIETLTNRLADE